MMVHANEDEGYLVIDGEIEWRAGDDPPRRYGPGALAWAPRGVAHGYTVSSPTARFLCQTTPAGLEGFFRQVGEPTETHDLPSAGTADQDEAERAVVTVTEYGVTSSVLRPGSDPARSIVLGHLTSGHPRSHPQYTRSPRPA
ncbi:cupin domain-containing protein [Actinomycetospora endophytica]|uniref:Cupin domain-containing protein n=1 Tax=Actinomycetospora endophytica TaxID=2291215 RepID=A0ABS8P5V4_9PSEU|nr:cupin domain-containing protein [Actinomycetospora endophytica]